MRPLARVICSLTAVIATIGGVSAAENLKINVGVFSNPSVSIWSPLVAQEGGYYSKHGLDATVKQMRGSNVTAAVLTNVIDVACTGLPTIAALMQGQPVVFVYGDGTIQPYTFITRKEITDVKSLKGKKLATPQVGLSSSHSTLLSILQTNGLSGSDVEWVELPDSATRARALISGRIDATLLSYDDTLLVSGRPEVHTLLDNPGKNVPLRPYVLCITRKDFARDNPETLKRWATAMVDTARRLDSDKAFYLEMIKRLKPDQFTPQGAEQLYETSHRLGFWSVNGGMDPAWYEGSVKFYVEGAKQTKRPPPLKDYYDDRFVRSALDKLGKLPSTTDPATWYKKP